MRILRASSLYAFVLTPCMAMNVYAGSAEEKLPETSLELLEFVADWTAQDGQWQDPIELMPMDDLDTSVENKEEKE